MFGQKNYPQRLGNGSFTIAEAGCFETAFCNLVERLNGGGPDPASLNQWFIDHGTYLHDSDGANEDLTWGSVSAYDPTIVTTGSGSGSLPPSTPAIVKFYYNSVHTGQPIDHFCLVDHIDGNQVWIVDSYDGIVKSPAGYQSVYHQPIAWATYAKVAAPAPPPPPPPAPAPEPVVYNENTDAEGIHYVLSDKPIKKYVSRIGGANRWQFGGVKAWSQFKSTGVTPYGTELYIYATAHHPIPPTGADYLMDVDAVGQFRSTGHVDKTIGYNYSDVSDNPPPDLTPPVQVVPPAATPVIVVTSPPPATTGTTIAGVGSTIPPIVGGIGVSKPDWRTTYKSFQDKAGNAVSYRYVALKNSVVPDLETKRGDLMIRQYDEVSISGTFQRAGTLYGRPLSAARKFYWYGIPMSVLTLESDVYDPSTDTALRQEVKNMNTRDYLVLATAKVENVLTKILDFFTPKSNNKK